MSYDVSLFRVETKQKEETYSGNNFFDDETNFALFTLDQIEQLRKRLISYHYQFQKKDTYGEHFCNHDEGTSALLTKASLYFTASMNEDEIFEVGMTASEFTDTGEFAKYDPQNGGWEVEE
jgi:hypothetical protein